MPALATSLPTFTRREPRLRLSVARAEDDRVAVA